LTPQDDFSRVQSRYFEAADARRYYHQTGNLYFSRTEEALLEGVRPRRGERLLEVGCGEGGNLFFLSSPEAQLYGIDLFPNKLLFAKKQLPQCRFLCSSADHLPFPGECFDIVLCRDVLHHLPDRERALKDLARVCRHGGRIVIIEPNGRNPIIRLQAWLVKAESGIRRNSPAALKSLLDRELGFSTDLQLRQPFPFFRIVLHYRFGVPGLSRWKVTRNLFNALDQLAAKIVPKSRWAYLVFEIEKR
jgi:ubiquinone/menaquinone biosynthesis C-methylase UbiE